MGFFLGNRTLSQCSPLIQVPCQGPLLMIFYSHHLIGHTCQQTRLKFSCLNIFKGYMSLWWFLMSGLLPTVKGEAVAVSCSGYCQEVPVNILIHYQRIFLSNIFFKTSLNRSFLKIGKHQFEQHTSHQCNLDPWKCILRSYPQTDVQLQVWLPANREFKKSKKSIYIPQKDSCKWKCKHKFYIPQKDSCTGRGRGFRRQYY